MDLEKLTHIFTFPWLFCQMLQIGLSVTANQVWESTKHAKVLSKGIADNFFIVPLIGFGLLLLFKPDPLLSIGFLIAICFSGAPMGPPFTGLAKGGLPFSIGLMVILAALTPLISPAVLTLLMGFLPERVGIGIGYIKIIKTILVGQFLPLAVGLALNRWIDLTQTKVVGVLVIDMIGHSLDRARNIFQISPGRSEASLQLAYEAHLANEVWNAKTEEWNRKPERTGLGHSPRSSDPKVMPVIARHPRLDGEVRTFDNPQSSMFNTDVQIFSDIGAPCILMMEDYDMQRTGYHDTHDTIENIDLDYASALSAICIETIAPAATIK